MTRLAFLTAAALAGATALGCSGDPGSGGNASFPAAALTTLKSDNAAFSVEVRTAPDQPPSRGLVSVEYRIAGKDGAPSDGLALTVVPWMPDMGHGASTVPTVTAEGGGRYVISGVQLFMPGRWELRTTIAGPPQAGSPPSSGPEDLAAPTFQIP